MLVNRAVPTLEQRIKQLQPTAWYRYNTGITVVGSGVDTWADQSGNGDDLRQTTDGNRPSLESDNTILFNGVDQQLEAAFTLNQPFTVYLLMKQVTWTDNDIITDGSTGAARLIQQTTSPRLKLFAGSAVADNDNLTVDTYGVVSYVINGASSLIQVNNSTATTGNAGATNPGGFSLGGSLSITSCSNIQVAECLIYSAAHDAEQRLLNRMYLNTVGTFNLGLAA